MNPDAPQTPPEVAPEPVDPPGEADQPMAETTGERATEEQLGEQAEPASGEIIPKTVRRAPKFASFGIVGALVGLVLGLVLGLTAFWSSPNRGSMVLILMVDFTLITTAIGLIWALISDRRSRNASPRGRRTVQD